MKRILVYGLSCGYGGIENIVLSILNRMPSDFVAYILLSKGNNCTYLDKLNKNINICYITSWGRNPCAFKEEIKKILINTTPDFVWINACITSNSILITATKKYSNAKIITHSHAMSFECDNIFKRLILLGMHYANRCKYRKYSDIPYMCSIPSGIWFYGKKFIAEDKAVVLKNGIDVVKFRYNSIEREHMREEMGLSEKLVLFHVGRLTSVKNQKFLLDILLEIKKQGKDAKLLIAGDGELKDELMTYSIELNVCDEVDFLGERSDVNRLYQCSDIYLQPSLNEGFGIALLEAQAAGLLCMASSGVPKEVQCLDDFYFLDLSSTTAKDWATVILKHSGKKNIRDNAYKSVINAGFDIKSVARSFFDSL